MGLESSRSAEKGEHAGKMLADKARYLARIALVGMALQGCSTKEEMLKQRDESIHDRIASSEILVEQKSSGTIQLSSGETIRIPRSSERFERVMLYLPKNRAPDKVFILFGQDHIIPKSVPNYLESMSFEEREASLKNVEESQRVIYEELKNLAEQGTIKKVCGEGFVSQKKIDKTLSEYRANPEEVTARFIAHVVPEFDISETSTVLSQQNAKTNDSGTEHEISKRLDKENGPQVERLYQPYKYVVGADLVLAAEGLISLCPAEYSATNRVANQFVSEIEKNPLSVLITGLSEHGKNLIFENRENAAIELSLSQGDPVIGITFGEAHDFTDAIERWNKKYPSTSIGLVDIRLSRDH